MGRDDTPSIEVVRFLIASMRAVCPGCSLVIKTTAKVKRTTFGGAGVFDGLPVVVSSDVAPGNFYVMQAEQVDAEVG